MTLVWNCLSCILWGSFAPYNVAGDIVAADNRDSSFDAVDDRDTCIDSSAKPPSTEWFTKFRENSANLKSLTAVKSFVK